MHKAAPIGSGFFNAARINIKIQELKGGAVEKGHVI